MARTRAQTGRKALGVGDRAFRGRKLSAASKASLWPRITRSAARRPFRFLDLPPELRNRIYEHVTEGDGTLVSIEDGMVDIMNPSFRSKPALVDTCRQIRTEAKPMSDKYYVSEHVFDAYCNNADDVAEAVEYVRKFLVTQPDQGPDNQTGWRDFIFKIKKVDFAGLQNLWSAVDLVYFINSINEEFRVVEVRLEYWGRWTRRGARFEQCLGRLFALASQGAQENWTEAHMRQRFVARCGIEQQLDTAALALGL